MVHRVTNHVNQRCRNLLGHHSVQHRVFALNHKLDEFLGLLRKVTNHAAHFLKDRSNFNHPHLGGDRRNGVAQLLNLAEFVWPAIELSQLRRDQFLSFIKL